ncbi:hypothetical protein Tco_0066503, partial [Tanacetum coccineum]
ILHKFLTYLVRVRVSLLTSGHLMSWHYGIPTNGPYQTNPLSPDDIISSIQIDREGQVRRIRHEEEIDVHEYQILTREIVPTLKPLEEIIRKDPYSAATQFGGVTINDGEQQLTVIVDGQTIAITEASVRRHLQLADADGISSLPITEIFDQLTLMGLEDDLKQTKKIYGKALTKLVKKVKHLEAKLKSTIERRKARMVIFDDEEDLVLEDISKQGRMTETEYEGFTLQQFTLIKVTQDASKEKVKTYSRRRSIDSSRDSTAGELQKQLDEREETVNIDWNTVAEQVQERQSDTIKRYQTLKKKPVSVAQARKNMMIYLKNMARYRMGYFKRMSYDEIRAIFEKEYNKIQTLFKKDTEVEKIKTKRIAKETLLQESFKKLRTAEASRVTNITEAYQGFEDMLKGFDREDLVTLWSLVKERFSSAQPTKDMERIFNGIELKRLLTRIK